MVRKVGGIGFQPVEAHTQAGSLCHPKIETRFRLIGHELNVLSGRVSKSPVRATRWGYRVKIGE